MYKSIAVGGRALTGSMAPVRGMDGLEIQPQYSLSSFSLNHIRSDNISMRYTNAIQYEGGLLNIAPPLLLTRRWRIADRPTSYERQKMSVLRGWGAE